MPILTDSGTTLADGTVQTLTDTVDNKYFTFKIDLTNMATGDTTVLKIYDMVLNGGALALWFTKTFVNAQTNPIFFLAPLWITEEIKITLQQTAGTNRNYDWCLLEA